MIIEPQDLTILFVSEHKPFHQTDFTFYHLGQKFSNFCYLCDFKGTKRPIQLFDWIINWKNLQSYTDSYYSLKNWDILFVRVDHYFKFLRNGAIFEIIKTVKPKKIIVSYQCFNQDEHFANEKKLLLLADGIVLLNNWSKEYLTSIYPELKDKPFFFLRSQFLPLKHWYGTYKPKKYNPNDTLKICVPGGSNKLNTGSGRWDYYNLLKVLASVDRVEVGIFGSFGSEADKKAYMEILPKAKFFGRSSEKEYTQNLEKYHLAFMNGFFPGNSSREFENSNYHVRYNNLIKANVLPIQAFPACTWHINEIANTGYGIILYSDTDLIHIKNKVKNYMFSESIWNKVVRENSFETYADELALFITERFR